MMTATRPFPIQYPGDSWHRIAIHEAGHAVAHLLLGHHVLDTRIGPGADGHMGTISGNTRFTGLNASALPELVGTAAGETAVLHLLNRQWTPNADAIARATANHDRERATSITAGTTLPIGIETALATRIVADYWDAVENVADALRRSDIGRLDQFEILAAADLGAAEIDWSELYSMANNAMPFNSDLQAYLNGPGSQEENVRVEFLRQLRAHNILFSPETAPRHQVVAEIFDRGLPEIQAAYQAAAEERAR